MTCRLLPQPPLARPQGVVNHGPRLAFEAFCLALGIIGCARTYLPTAAKATNSPAAATVIESLRLSWQGTEFQVKMRVAAPTYTQLRNAHLALRDDKPCDAGLPLEVIELDGVHIHWGPADLGGEHEIKFVFGGQYGNSRKTAETLLKSASQPAYVDLNLETPDRTRTCTRVALIGDPAAPRWRLSDSSAGAFVSIYGRAYPAGFGSKSDIEPSGGLGERGGAILGASRVWFDFGAAYTNQVASRHVVLSVGGDHAFWQGDWALRVGLGYDVALNIYRPDLEHQGHLRYVLHGPHASFGLSYALIRSLVLSNLSTHPAFPDQHRTLTLDLEVPVSLWFGTGAALMFQLASGAHRALCVDACAVGV
jgi:hypothetical protein